MTYDPWHPNPKAIEKVKDKLPAPTKCRYCEGEVIMANNSFIYNGTSYGGYPWIFVCLKCSACIGMHPETNIPLGILANNKLRKLRMEVKNLFNPIWQSGKMSRTLAYQSLAAAMNIHVSSCHFGMFEMEDCVAALDAIKRGLQPKDEVPAWKSQLKEVVEQLDTTPKFKSFKNAKKLRGGK
jgi:hypothetical protein